MASAKPETGLSKRASGPLSKKERTLSVGALEAALFRAFPKEDVEDWDRAGLTVGDPSRQVTRVAVALDPTVAAIHEAASRGAKAGRQICISSDTGMRIRRPSVITSG